MKHTSTVVLELFATSASQIHSSDTNLLVHSSQAHVRSTLVARSLDLFLRRPGLLRHCSRSPGNTAKLNPRLTRSDDGRFAAEPRSWDLHRQTEGTAQKLKLVLCQKAFLQADVQHVQGANIEAQRDAHRLHSPPRRLNADIFHVLVMESYDRLVSAGAPFRTCTGTSYTEGSWASAR